MIELTEPQKKVLSSTGHLLVKGGPGSGKTTVSIIKASQIVPTLSNSGQQVLFLSFARATVARIIEAISSEENISSTIKSRIEVSTYHSFFWNILKSHGYLLGLPRRLEILTPASAAVALSTVRDGFDSEGQDSTAEQRSQRGQAERAEMMRLAREQGLVCFDIFAELVDELLKRGRKIRRLVCNAYPTIILDEFQDTDAAQWRVIKSLGRGSCLVALGDPEQRIFDFIGAHPKRLQHFEESFEVTTVDLGPANHRSGGTDVATFGNDILTGTFTKENYHGVEFELYEPNKNQAIVKLVSETLNARKRLVKRRPNDWTLAILVPTKRMTRLVSDAFREPIGNLPKISHHASIDLEAAILAAEVIAYALQSNGTEPDFDEFVRLLCNYFQGKGGDRPSKTNIQEAKRVRTAFQKAVGAREAGNKVAKNSIFLAIESAILSCCSLKLTGDPDKDWVKVRKHLANQNCKRLSEIAIEVKNIRLLDRGTELRDSLARVWKDSGFYSNALGIVRQAFVKEHFATSTRQQSGILVMNMHKAKGKQFDEVIIFEGWPHRARGAIVGNPGRIVRSNLRSEVNEHTRQNFRVSITRAKTRTTILTPKGDPCVLLLPPK